MSGPILGEVARMKRLGTMFVEDDDETNLPLSDRPYDPCIGAEQLSHAKQRIRNLTHKVTYQFEEIHLLMEAIEKRNDLLTYIREVLLHDVLNLIQSDAKKLEYSRAILSVLDDERLKCLHEDMKQLLQRDHLKQKDQLIRELESREMQLRRVSAEKEKRILAIEGEKAELSTELKKQRMNLQQHHAVATSLRNEIADLQRKLSNKDLHMETVHNEMEQLRDEIGRLKFDLSEANNQVGTLTETLDNYNVNAEQGKESMAAVIQEMNAAAADVVRYQETSVVAARLSTHWSMCRTQMTDGLERIRQALRSDAITSQAEGLGIGINNVLKFATVEMASVKALSQMLHDEREGKVGDEDKRVQTSGAISQTTKDLRRYVCGDLGAGAAGGGRTPQQASLTPGTAKDPNAWASDPVKFAQLCDVVADTTSEVPIEGYREAYGNVLAVVKKIASGFQTVFQKLTVLEGSSSASLQSPSSPVGGKSSAASKALEKAGLGTSDGVEGLFEASHELRQTLQQLLVSGAEEEDEVAADHAISQSMGEVSLSLAKCSAIPREFAAVFGATESLVQLSKTRTTASSRKIRQYEQKTQELSSEIEALRNRSPAKGGGLTPLDNSSSGIIGDDNLLATDSDPLVLSAATLNVMVDSLVAAQQKGETNADAYIKWRQGFKESLEHLRDAVNVCYEQQQPQQSPSPAHSPNATLRASRQLSSTSTASGPSGGSFAPGESEQGGEGATPPLPPQTPLRELVLKLVQQMERLYDEPNVIFDAASLDAPAANRVSTDFAHCLDREKPMSIRMQHIDSLRLKRGLPTLWPAPPLTPRKGEEGEEEAAETDHAELAIQCELLTERSLMETISDFAATTGGKGKTSKTKSVGKGVRPGSGSKVPAATATRPASGKGSKASPTTPPAPPPPPPKQTATIAVGTEELEKLLSEEKKKRFLDVGLDARPLPPPPKPSVAVEPTKPTPSKAPVATVQEEPKKPKKEPTVTTVVKGIQTTVALSLHKACQAEPSESEPKGAYTTSKAMSRASSCHLLEPLKPVMVSEPTSPLFSAAAAVDELTQTTPILQANAASSPFASPGASSRVSSAGSTRSRSRPASAQQRKDSLLSVDGSGGGPASPFGAPPTPVSLHSEPTQMTPIPVVEQGTDADISLLESLLQAVAEEALQEAQRLRLLSQDDKEVQTDWSLMMQLKEEEERKEQQSHASIDIVARRASVGAKNSFPLRRPSSAAPAPSSPAPVVAEQPIFDDETSAPLEFLWRQHQRPASAAPTSTGASHQRVGGARPQSAGGGSAVAAGYQPPTTGHRSSSPGGAVTQPGESVGQCRQTLFDMELPCGMDRRESTAAEGLIVGTGSPLRGGAVEDGKESLKPRGNTVSPTRRGGGGVKEANWGNVAFGGTPIPLGEALHKGTGSGRQEHDSVQYPLLRMDYSSSSSPQDGEGGGQRPRPGSPLRKSSPPRGGGGTRQSQPTPVTIQVPEQYRPPGFANVGVSPSAMVEHGIGGSGGVAGSGAGGSAPRVRRRDQVELMHRYISTHIDRHFGQRVETPQQTLVAAINKTTTPSTSTATKKGATGGGTTVAEPLEALLPTQRPVSAGACSTAGGSSSDRLQGAQGITVGNRVSIREIAEQVAGEQGPVTVSLRNMSPVPRPASASLVSPAGRSRVGEGQGGGRPTRQQRPSSSSSAGGTRGIRRVQRSQGGGPAHHAASNSKKGSKPGGGSMALSALGIVHVPDELAQLLTEFAAEES